MTKSTITERSKALRTAIAAVEKQYGKGAITTLGDGGPHIKVESISSGALSIDKALGTGGYPKGRIVEIFGPESSGKTTLALHAIAECQKKQGVAAFLDAEHALDISYAERLGVNCESLLVSQPDCGEQCLEICDLLISSGGIDLVVIDSVAALIPQAEIEGKMGDHHVGAQARLMSQALRKLARVTHQSQSIVIFLNQLRQKIGVMFGSPETTTGGNALKFFSSQRIDVRRVGAIKKESEMIGNRTKIKIVKNKLAPPFRYTEIDIIYGKGVDSTSDLLDLSVESGLVKKSGAWYSMEKGDRIGQGRDQACQWLLSHKKEAAALETRLRKEVLVETTEKSSDQAA